MQVTNKTKNPHTTKITSRVEEKKEQIALRARHVLVYSETTWIFNEGNWLNIRSAKSNTITQLLHIKWRQSSSVLPTRKREPKKSMPACYASASCFCIGISGRAVRSTGSSPRNAQHHQHSGQRWGKLLSPKARGCTAQLSPPMIKGRRLQACLPLWEAGSATSVPQTPSMKSQWW